MTGQNWQDKLDAQLERLGIEPKQHTFGTPLPPLEIKPIDVDLESIFEQKPSEHREQSINFDVKTVGEYVYDKVREPGMTPEILENACKNLGFACSHNGTFNNVSNSEVWASTTHVVDVHKSLSDFLHDTPSLQQIADTFPNTDNLVVGLPFKSAEYAMRHEIQQFVPLAEVSDFTPDPCFEYLGDQLTIGQQFDDRANAFGCDISVICTADNERMPLHALNSEAVFMHTTASYIQSVMAHGVVYADAFDPKFRLEDLKFIEKDTTHVVTHDCNYTKDMADHSTAHNSLSSAVNKAVEIASNTHRVDFAVENTERNRSLGYEHADELQKHDVDLEL